MFRFNRRSCGKKRLQAAARRPQAYRAFEWLEDRRLLTTFNVTTTIDRLDTANVTLAHPKGLDGKLSLREAIYLANLHPGSDIVALKSKSTYGITIAGTGEDNDATGDFDVSDDLTIKGSGSSTVINGNGLDRVLDVSGDVTLTLDHVVITGGIARGNGGGINAASDDTLMLTCSSVTHNISTSPGGGFGGGIYLEQGILNLTNSHVDNNSAAAGVQGEGGGIYIGGGSGDTTIKNSTINNNSAYIAGGGFYTFGINSLTMTGSQINNNHSGEDGGGMTLSTGVATFTADSVSGNTTGGIGGGINSDSSRLIFANSNVSNNTAASDAGAISLRGGEIIATNSTFANNTSGGLGGALGDAGEVTLTGCAFTHNVAQGDGGAIYQTTGEEIDITKSTFTQNAALTGAGGAVHSGDGAPIDITDSKFTFNSALEGGGALLANGGPVTVLRSTFDHDLVGDGNGGAIDGGDNPSNIGATDSMFTNNKSKADGGAFDSEGGDILVVRCVISGNTATNGMGGGFADEGTVSSTITVTDSTVNGNTAGGDGGGFTATGSMLTMTGSTVSNNRSGSEGGGMYVLTLDDTEITNCTISGNGGAIDGGGVAVPFGAQHVVRFINDTIAFNVSATGGGIFNDAQARPTLCIWGIRSSRKTLPPTGRMSSARRGTTKDTIYSSRSREVPMWALHRETSWAKIHFWDPWPITVGRRKRTRCSRAVRQLMLPTPRLLLLSISGA